MWPSNDHEKWIHENIYHSSPEMAATMDSIFRIFPEATIGRVVNLLDWAIAVLDTKKRRNDPPGDSIWSDAEVARWTGWDIVHRARDARASAPLKHLKDESRDEAVSDHTQKQLPLDIRGKEYPEMLPRSADPH